MTFRVNGTDSHVKRRASILCLALFGLSFLVSAPFLLSSSLPSSSATSAATLSISVAPSLLLASSGFNATMTVQLMNVNTGTPVYAAAPVEVILTSSNTAVADVQVSPLFIQTGKSYAIENLTAGGSKGSALIKASAQGYFPASFSVSAELSPTSLTGFTTSLAPFFAPQAILSDNRTYPKMVIGELQATNGNGTIFPEVAPSNVTVWARSSDNSTMQVSTSPFIIIHGNVYSMFNISSTYFQGSANITMQANGLTPVTTGLTSYSITGTSKQPAPAFFVLNTVTPSRVMPGQPFKVLIYAQTEYAPISSVGANLTWSAHGANITSSVSNLNATGDGWATFIASQQSGLDNVSVLIKENGITPYLDNISLNSYLNNMTLSTTNSHPAIVTDYATTFAIRAVFNNTGVANANISWVVNNGTLVSPPSTTNATGYALVTYQSGSKPGNFTIEAKVSKLGYTNATQDVNFLVVPRVTTQVQPPGPTNILYTKIGNILPLWALIPIIAGAGVGGFFVIRRYRNGEVGYYDDEE